jgi:hypothetical protein
LRKIREDTIEKEKKRCEKRESIVERNLAAALKIHEKERRERLKA